jgi:diketogulonate reductase-like aldo/keto reductase
LGTTYLDSYVLHGPTVRYGLADEDWEIWGAMEDLARAGKTKMLGVSNVDLEQLQQLDRGAKIRPRFVQNRCFARDRWDEDVRAYCRERDIVYQGFSLLTANPQVVNHAELARLASARKKTPAQLVFAYTIELGILPLTGTKNEHHMKQDLEASSLQLDDKERALLARLR